MFIDDATTRIRILTFHEHRLRRQQEAPVRELQLEMRRKAINTSTIEAAK